MDKVGVNIANCKYILNTTSTGIGTNPSSYTGGGFTKATNDKITFSCSSSGTYYLHVLTVDNAGNKKETISSAINVQKLVKWLIKDGKIMDSSYHFVSWSPSVSQSSGGVYFSGSTPYRGNYRSILGSFKCFFCD